MSKKDDKVILVSIVLMMLGGVLLLQGLDIIDFGLGYISITTSYETEAGFPVGTIKIPTLGGTTAIAWFGTSDSYDSVYYCNKWLDENNGEIYYRVSITPSPSSASYKLGGTSARSKDGVLIYSQCEGSLFMNNRPALPSFRGLSAGEFTYKITYYKDEGHTQRVLGKVKSEERIIKYYDDTPRVCTINDITGNNHELVSTDCDCQGDGFSEHGDGYCNPASNYKYVSDLSSSTLRSVCADMSLPQGTIFDVVRWGCVNEGFTTPAPEPTSIPTGVPTSTPTGVPTSTPTVLPTLTPEIYCTQMFGGYQGVGECTQNEVDKTKCVDGSVQVCRELASAAHTCWLDSGHSCTDTEEVKDNEDTFLEDDGVCDADLTETCANSIDCICGEGTVCDTELEACVDDTFTNPCGDKEWCYDAEKEEMFCAESCELNVCDEFPNLEECQDVDDEGNGNGFDSTNLLLGAGLLFLLVGAGYYLVGTGKIKW